MTDASSEYNPDTILLRVYKQSLQGGSLFEISLGVMVLIVFTTANIYNLMAEYKSIGLIIASFLAYPTMTYVVYTEAMKTRRVRIIVTDDSVVEIVGKGRTRQIPLRQGVMVGLTVPDDETYNHLNDVDGIWFWTKSDDKDFIRIFVKDGWEKRDIQMVLEAVQRVILENDLEVNDNLQKYLVDQM